MLSKSGPSGGGEGGAGREKNGPVSEGMSYNTAAAVGFGGWEQCRVIPALGKLRKFRKNWRTVEAHSQKCFRLVVLE